MSLTFLGWLPLRSMGSRREQHDPKTCKARLKDIEARPKLGKLNKAEADAMRLALLSRLRSSSWGCSQHLQGTAGTLILAPAVFLLVVGIGAAASYVGDPPEATASGDTLSFSLSHSGSDGDVLARLTDYARSIGTEEPAMTVTGKLLPDVNTMIERLAARLETTPKDIEGWRMLGWAYFQTARYEQAVTAYARAIELDPTSADLKLSYEEAKAKASGSDNLETREGNTQSEVMPLRERDAAIRSTVDGLADRLEKSPSDVEGWILLMRSRVVLGEREVAATAFHKALELFKDDSAASGKISATAIELGLTAE